MGDAINIRPTISGSSIGGVRQRWPELLSLLAIIALFFLLYYPVLSVGMISDDFLHTKNIANWGDIWREQGGWTFRFVGNFIFWLDGFIWKGDFAGRHLDSIIIQLFNILIVFCIAKRLFADQASAVLCTAIYAFHFANVNSVAWPCDKWTLSSATFILLGFYFSLRYFDGYGKLCAAVALLNFVLGLLTKENVMMLLPILVLFQLTRGKKLGDFWHDKHLRHVYMLFSSVLALYLVYRFGLAGKVAREGFAPGGVYPISAVKALLGFPFYVTYSFIPFDFFEFFHLDPEAIRNLFKTQLKGPLPYFAFCVFAIIGSFVAIKSLKFWDRNLAFGVGWFSTLLITFVFWFDIRWLNPATFGVAVVFTSVAERLQLIRSWKVLVSKPVDISAINFMRALLLGALLICLLVSSAIKVHRWVESGELVKSILYQTKEINPIIKPHSFVIFLNLPDKINQVHVFRNGIEQAMRDEYGDSSITVSYNSRIFEGLILPDHFCEYAKKYKNFADAALKKGGEVLLLYFDASSHQVNAFQCPHF